MGEETAQLIAPAFKQKQSRAGKHGPSVTAAYFSRRKVTEAVLEMWEMTASACPDASPGSARGSLKLNTCFINCVVDGDRSLIMV